ncbi:hypothetical protein HK101_004472 [Irineochytrium annulatum]|nr:hypothetical protein HK101_004472 [Irineochytrium annulatum]
MEVDDRHGDRDRDDHDGDDSDDFEPAEDHSQHSQDDEDGPAVGSGSGGGSTKKRRRTGDDQESAAERSSRSIYEPVPIYPRMYQPAAVPTPPAPGAGLHGPPSAGGHSTSVQSATSLNDANSSTSSPAGAKAKGKKPAPQQAKRRKVAQAYEGRPCQRCIKRKIAHLCHDEAKPPGQPGSGEGGVASANSYDAHHSTTDHAGPSTTVNAASDIVAAAAAAVAAGASLPPAVVAAVASALPTLGDTPGSNAPMSNNALSRPFSFPSLSAFPPLFASEHMGNEFTILTDFLASLDESNRSPMGAAGMALQHMDASQMNGEGPSRTVIPASTSGLGINDPGSQLSSTEKFVLTAADPGDGSYDDRLNQVITAKFEAGLLKPYNYINSYTRLQRWMETHMSPASRARILNVMGVFRPKFRWIAQSLTDIDLVLVEEAFERLLLEYDRVFSSMGIPSCLWRRTGEICKCNKEFASLVGLPMERLRDGRVHIYELMSEESAVNYWEKYGNIAFDANQKAVLTSCVLKGLDGTRSVNCCFSFTIRRDRYNIPLMGNDSVLLCMHKDEEDPPNLTMDYLQGMRATGDLTPELKMIPKHGK